MLHYIPRTRDHQAHVAFGMILAGCLSDARRDRLGVVKSCARSPESADGRLMQRDKEIKGLGSQ